MSLEIVAHNSVSYLYRSISLRVPEGFSNTCIDRGWEQKIIITTFISEVNCHSMTRHGNRWQDPWSPRRLQDHRLILNKANLGDLIAATGLVILLKLDSNRRFFSPCDLEIWWMTPKNNRAPLLCSFKLFVSFRSHWWIQTGVTVCKCLIWVKIYDFFSRVTLKFDGWPSKTRGHLFYATSSLVHHFVAIGEFELEL